MQWAMVIQNEGLSLFMFIDAGIYQLQIAVSTTYRYLYLVGVDTAAAVIFLQCTAV